MAKGHGPLMTNIRLRPPAGLKVTRQVLSDVVDSLRDGRVPRGWQFAAIEWQNPKAATAGWKRGAPEDLDRFVPVLNKIAKSDLVNSFRAGLVEGGRPPTGKAKASLEKQIREADKAVRDAGKARQKAIRERDKRKTAEARKKWSREADLARVAYGKAASKLEKFTRRLEGARREYELAVRYKGRKGGR